MSSTRVLLSTLKTISFAADLLYARDNGTVFLFSESVSLSNVFTFLEHIIFSQKGWRDPSTGRSKKIPRGNCLVFPLLFSPSSFSLGLGKKHFRVAVSATKVLFELFDCEEASVLPVSDSVPNVKMSVQSVNQWIEENQDSFLPPVCNKLM